MTVSNVEVPRETLPIVAQFAQFLADSEKLTEQIDTTVEIEVKIPDGDGGPMPTDNRQYVEVYEHGNDGYELVPVKEDGEIVRYDPEGTSKVGLFVQDLADDFFGHHNYACGFYQDEHCSETTITPSPS